MARANGIAQLAVFVCLSLLGPACSSRDSQDAPSAGATATAELATVSIPIEGMTCAACVARVKKGLASLDGVAEVEVSLAERHARVRYTPDKLSAAQLALAINDLGFQARVPVEVR